MAPEPSHPEDIRPMSTDVGICEGHGSARPRSMAMKGYELMHVSCEIVERIEADSTDPQPIQTVDVKRHGNGTIELIFQHPVVNDAMVERATEAWREAFLYSDDEAGVRAALVAAFARESQP